MSRTVARSFRVCIATLVLTSAAYAQTESEPNNTTATANAIACGQTLTGSISPAADVDYYTFTLAAPADLQMYVTPSGTFSGDTLIDFIAADGTTIIETDDDSADGLSSAIGRVAQAAGTYFLKVRPFSATATFNYTVTVLCLNQTVEIEPNGTLATATPTTCAAGGGAGDLILTDTDYWSFTVDTTTQFVRALCLPAPDTAATTLALFDSAGTAVTTAVTDSGSNLGSRTTAVLAPGSYVWRVASTTAAAFHYNLTFTCTPCTATETEANNTTATANSITLPASIDCATITPGTDVDYYTFTVASTVVFSARTGPNPSLGSTNTILAIFNSTPTLVVSNDDCNSGDTTSCLNGVTLTAGTYFLRVSQTSATITYGYQLTASAVPCTGAEIEPNGTSATATAIPLPATIDCAQISPAADVDYYTFTVPAFSTVRISTNPTSGADTVLTIFDATLAQVAENDNCTSPSGTHSCINTPLVAGTYYARVRAFSATAVFSYGLTASATPCVSPEIEPNDAFGTATALTVPATVDCALVSPAADNDYYSFTLGGLSALTATTAPSSGADTVMTLYDSTFTMIDQNDNCSSPSGTGSCIRRIVAGGTYYIQINALSPTATFGYSLTVSASSCPSGESEPNGTSATANALAFPATVDCAFVSPSADNDYYSFTIPCGLSVTLRTGPTGLANDTILTLYDGALVQLAENDDCVSGTDFSSCITMSLSAGSYFAKVRPFSSTAVFNYTLAISGVDTTAPVVTCPADITVECTGTGGEIVTYSASAADDCDPIPSLTLTPPSGSTFALGTTLVTASALDASGNVGECTFNVIVRDTIAPIVACPNDISVKCISSGGEVVSFSVSASDVCDPSPSVACVPPSGSTFPAGNTTVNCTAMDDSGNSRSCAFVVRVSDAAPPTISCPGSVSLECTTLGGEVVTYTATATDACDPDPFISCSPASGSVFPLGTTIVVCTAKDDSGNFDTCSFSVSVTDTVPPTITCPSDMFVGADTEAGAVVTFTVTASDACDASPTIVCTPASGSVFPTGLTPVSCTATDDSGNDDTCGFNVLVVACRTGNVNGGVGPIADVLFFNGSNGGALREMTVVAGSPVMITMIAPPSNPLGPSPFAVYAYRGAPDPTTVRNNPFGIGVTCMPTPLTGDGPPNPSKIWNNTGRPELGVANLASVAAPSTLLNRPQGITTPTTFFIQGFIEDANAPNGDLAVTNGIVVHVIP